MARSPRCLLAFAGLAVACTVIGCGKGKSGEGSAAPPSAAAGSAPAAPPADAPAGMQIKADVLSEFSGSYDRVFARIATEDKETVIAFVRDCPKLTCDVGAWEPEQVAAVCPKAFLATFKVPGLAAGRFKLDLHLAGPADSASTGTLEGVSLQLTAVGPDGVTGTASQETTESKVKAKFTAQVCPRT